MNFFTDFFWEREINKLFEVYIIHVIVKLHALTSDFTPVLLIRRSSIDSILIMPTLGNR